MRDRATIADFKIEDARYEAREKGIKIGMQRGKKHWIEQGIEQGIQQGMQRGKRHWMQQGMEQERNKIISILD